MSQMYFFSPYLQERATMTRKSTKTINKQSYQEQVSKAPKKINIFTVGHKQISLPYSYYLFTIDNLPTVGQNGDYRTPTNNL